MQESHKSPDLTQTQATLMRLSMYKLKWLINILNAANKKGKYFGGERNPRGRTHCHHLVSLLAVGAGALVVDILHFQVLTPG